MEIATPVDLIILDEKLNILLVRRNENEDLFKGYWSIPGGGPKNNETFEEALQREIKEELSCEIILMKYFKSYLYRLSNNILVRSVYFYGNIKGNIKINKELIEFRWFNIDEIRSLDLAFNQKQVLLEFIRLELKK